MGWEGCPTCELGVVRYVVDLSPQTFAGRACIRDLGVYKFPIYIWLEFILDVGDFEDIGLPYFGWG